MENETDDSDEGVSPEDTEIKYYADSATNFIGNAKDFVNSANSLMQTMKDGGIEFREIVNSLIEYKKVEQVTKREIKKYETMIEGINFYRDVFVQMFDQRQQAINKYFEVIDKGMAENNLELISQGLSNLSFVVASSPFKDIGELRLAIESDKKIVL